jgi:hypothetical protein
LMAIVSIRSFRQELGEVVQRDDDRHQSGVADQAGDQLEVDGAKLAGRAPRQVTRLGQEADRLVEVPKQRRVRVGDGDGVDRRLFGAGVHQCLP